MKYIYEWSKGKHEKKKWENRIFKILICGNNYDVTSVVLINEIPQEVTLWEGELISDNWSDQPYALSDAGLELAAVNAQPGQIVYLYIEQIGDEPWKLEVCEGQWEKVPAYCAYCAVGADTEGGKFTEWDLDANGGKIPVVLTQEMLDAAYVQQWWGGTFVLNGDNTKCTMITIL